MSDDLIARLQAQLAERRRLSAQLDQLQDTVDGVTEHEDPAPWWARATLGQRSASGTARGRLRGVGPTSVTVIVPVHNAAEELEVCLRALARHTTFPAAILLIDDASTDPRIEGLFEAAAHLEGVRVLRNVVNLGFTATINRGLRSCTGDVVLLNSDTAVGPRWLEGLIDTAYSAVDIATVTPVSDNAGAFSVPLANQPNPLPAQLGPGDVARLLSGAGSTRRPEAPTGNGFCLYIKRAALDAVGALDADAFPRGYGEENDFCMRALKAGWRHLVDGRTFVHHERESSFGEQKAALIAAGRAKVDERHPEYTALARAFVASEAMDELRAAAGAALAATPATVRPRLLFVIHDGGGGAIATNRDLMRALEPEFDSYVFSSDRWTLRFAHQAGGQLETLQEWPLEKAILLADFTRPEYREAFAVALEVARPELVHVRHVFKHTLDAPKMAAERAIPIVMSIHDYYTICPTIQLVDNNGRFCGGPCSPGHGECPTLVKAGRLPPLKHAFVYQWREEMAVALSCADALVTTSEQTREIHRQMHPEIRGTRFELIEHGRDLTQASGLGRPPVPGGPVRILIPGNFDRHKGAELIAAMRELDVEGRLELHFLGEVPERHRHLGIMHGTYARESFQERVGEIAPAFIGIFSVWAETYNHVLTEAWAAGVPALVTDIGAPAERVRAHGGGFVVPLEDPARALAAILAAADDRAAYEQQAAQATLHDIPSVAQMTERYAELYRDVLDRRRVIGAPDSAPGASLGRGTWRMTAVIKGRYPSAYVRVLRRYEHPEVQWKLRTRIRTTADRAALEDSDLVLVQRHAIPSDEVGEFIADVRRRRLPLVLDLDDHLLGSGYGDAAQYAPEAESLRVLLDAAALVTVSTPALAETVGELCRRVVVVPNQLDERLFLTGTSAEPPDAAEARASRPLRLVYAGSPSHAEDLAFLRQVLERLEREQPGAFALDVVGGEPAGEATWYRRREIPEGSTGYPSYVALLREWRPEWDIAVAPLLDSEFNRHKSDLKFLEYAGLGLPGVYSAVEPYASVRDGETGRVVANDVEAWCAALRELAGDEVLRRKIQQQAWQEVRGRRLLRDHAGELLELLGTVLREGEPVPAPVPTDAQPAAVGSAAPDPLAEA